MTALDFGLNPCGGLAPAGKTFTLSNAGGTAATITAATLVGATGYTTDALNKTIPANGTLVVTVNAPGIPQISATPGDYSATLTFQTNIAGDTGHAVALTEGASGAILTLEAADSFGTFGTISAGSTAKQTFKITNSGNADAILTATTATPFVLEATTFTVLKGQSSDNAVTFDGASAAGLVAGGHAGTLSFSPTTTLCGVKPLNVSLTANTLNGGIVVSTGSINFYPSCNDPSPPSSTFTVTNTGNAAITFTSSLFYQGFNITPAAGTVVSLPPADAGNPGQNTVTVTVSPLANLVTPANFGDVVTITTSGILGDSPHKVGLLAIPQGDVISVATPGGTDFGQIPIINPARTGTLQVLFRNDANPSPSQAVAHVTLTNPAGLFSLDVSSFELAPQTSRAVTVTFAPGTDKSILGGDPSKPFDTTIGWTIGSDINCGGSVGAGGTVAMHAVATAAEVSVSPSSLVFGAGGLVNCGAQAQPLNITLSNPGANAYTVSNVLLTGPYFDWSTSGAVVAPGASQTITVTPKAIPPSWGVVPDGTAAKPSGVFNGSISFQTDAPNDSTHVIPLYMGAKGVIISGAPPSATTYVFNPVGVGGQSFFNIAIKNSGNVTAQATLSLLNGSGVFGITPSPTNIVTGAPDVNGDFQARSTTLNLFYKPVIAPAVDNDTAYLSVVPTAGNVFCLPLPASWVNLGTAGVSVQGSSTGN